MNKFTNKGQVPLSLAVWLMDDDYDHDDDPNVISATSLLKPIRSIVLARQSKELTKEVDLLALVPPRMGTAIHTSIENSWLKTEKVKENLRNLGGTPDSVIDRIIVNPEPEDIKEDSICVYMEVRKKKQVGKFVISGKFDIVIDGGLEDFKSSGTYGYVSGSNDNQYMQQGSIYRWLNPNLITEDTMKIQYIFTDWSAQKARQSRDYPQKRTVEKQYNLMSIQQTETFIKTIINKITALEDKPQSELPQCTRDELWQDEDVWKYYKDPNKTTRATKNFTSSHEAYTRHQKDGGVGVVIHYPGKVKRCHYCDVIGVCEQAAQLSANGVLDF